MCPNCEWKHANTYPGGPIDFPMLREEQQYRLAVGDAKKRAREEAALRTMKSEQYYQRYREHLDMIEAFCHRRQQKGEPCPRHPKMP